MKNTALTAATAALLLVLAAGTARAQATRTWVSGVGDDANPCSRTAPCKTFAGAISKTAAGGEISVLDPGGFGTVTITKAITISGDGTLAGILAGGTNGVIVNAGVSDQVILRNISIAASTASPCLDGIRFLAGKSLTLDKVTISGCSGDGIEVNVTTADHFLFVRDTAITNIGGSGLNLTSTATNGIAASLRNVHLTRCANGVLANANSRVDIGESVLTGNTSCGVNANSATAQINIEGSELSFNVIGVLANVSGATVRVADNDIYGNGNGIVINAGSVVKSAGNNRVDGNGATTPPGVLIPLQ